MDKMVSGIWHWFRFCVDPTLWHIISFIEYKMTPDELKKLCYEEGFDWLEDETGFMLHWSIKEDDAECTHITLEALKDLEWPKIKHAVIGGRDVIHITRIVGYYSHVENWNQSKVGELKDRRKGDYGWGSQMKRETRTDVNGAIRINIFGTQKCGKCLKIKGRVENLIRRFALDDVEMKFWDQETLDGRTEGAWYDVDGGLPVTIIEKGIQRLKRWDGDVPKSEELQGYLCVKSPTQELIKVA